MSVESQNLIFNYADDKTIDFNTVDPNDLSWYTVDFVTKVIADKARVAINANPDVVYNPYFSDVLAKANKLGLEMQPNDSDVETNYICYYPTRITDIDISSYNPPAGQSCSNPKIAIDLLFPLVKAWNLYLQNPTATSIRATQNFDTIASKIVAQTRTGDYFKNYNQINYLWMNSLNILQKLSTASVTEKKIIDNSVNVEAYYDSLKFSDSDVTPALVLSADMVDLVPYESFNQSLRSNAANLYAQIEADGDIMGTSAGRLQENTTSKMLADLTTQTTTLPDIENLPNGLRILTQTKIYKDENGNPVALLEDPKQSSDRIAKLQAAQTNFLDRLDKLPDSRGQTYAKVYTLGLSGGRTIDLDSFEDQDKSKTIILTLDSQVRDLVGDFYAKQELYYTDPKSPISTQSVLKKNTNFMELQRLLSAESPLLRDTYKDSTSDATLVQKYITDYKTLVASYLYKLNLASESDITEIKAKLLSDISNLDTSSPLDSIFRKSTIDTEQVEIFSEALPQLAEKIKLTDAAVADTHTIPELIASLESISEQLTLATNKLESDFARLSVRGDQIEMIRKRIGVNLEADLKLGNILIEDLIFINKVNDFNLKSLEIIKSESKKSQHRLNDLETYLKGIQSELTGIKFTNAQIALLKQHVSQPEDSGVVFDVSSNIDLQDFYKRTVDDYFNSTLTNVQNLSTYSVLNKRLNALIDEADFFTWNKIAKLITDEPISRVTDIDAARENLSRSMYLNFPENGLGAGPEISWLINNYVIFKIDRINNLHTRMFTPDSDLYLHGDLSRINAINWLLSMIEHNYVVTNTKLDYDFRNLSLDEKIDIYEKISQVEFAERPIPDSVIRKYPNWQSAYEDLRRQLETESRERKTNYNANVAVLRRRTNGPSRIPENELSNNFTTEINSMRSQVDNIEVTKIDSEVDYFYTNNLNVGSKACLIIALVSDRSTQLILEELGLKLDSLVKLCDAIQPFSQDLYINGLLNSATGTSDVLSKNLVTKFVEDVKVELASEPEFQSLVEKINFDDIYDEVSADDDSDDGDGVDNADTSIHNKNLLIATYNEIHREVYAFARDIEIKMYGLVQNSGIASLVLIRDQLKYYFASCSALNGLFSSAASTNSSLNPGGQLALIKGSFYAANKDLYDEIIRKISTITSRIDPSIGAAYDAELEIVLEIENINRTIGIALAYGEKWTGFRTLLVKRNLELMSSVMFSPLMTQQYLSNTELNQILVTAIGDNTTILTMIKSKLDDLAYLNNHQILYNDQINNYLAGKMVMGRTLQGHHPVAVFYKQMSFGIVEYYYDIMDSILMCLDKLSEPFEEANEVGRYLYRYHYISLKRCYALFRWLIVDYLTGAKVQDPQIVKYKILTTKTSGSVLEVYTEFHLLRRYLDEFSATMMDKVQLHLRINDFVSGSYNAVTKTKYPDAEFLLDTDPYSETYAKRWANDDLIFTNKNNSNKLNISFNLLDRILTRTGRSKPFNAYYQKTYSAMQTRKGINFKRIYNTTVFPNADVIASYMSIAPNIVNNQGTVIMTYGYSGVGKSASLFGVKANLPQQISASNGMLQATLDQFSGAQIYFRVYEIYGLGTQYNYYWNPTSASGNLDCHPNFNQLIIQHDIQTAGSILGLSGKTVLQNRSQAFAYIMELRDPKNSSSYKKISESHYRNFTDFITKIDATREQGIDITRAFTHLVSQVKSTINNPISSRSILVYDFEINVDPKNNVCVPFLIYDLPGNEDILQTYVTPNLDSVLDNTVRSRIFADVVGDGPNKERKSAYVMNPILTPIFDDNLNILTKVLSEANIDTRSSILQELLDYTIVNYNLDVINNKYRPNGTSFKISSLYKSQPTNLADMFNPAKLLDRETITSTIKRMNKWSANPIFTSDKIVPDHAFAIYLLDVLGAIGTQYQLNPVTITTASAAKEILILVGVVVVGFLIKYQYIDILVETIYRINRANDSDSDTGENGKWSRNKIYAFFEAYYINENVMGLLQYLTTNILAPTENSSANEIGIQAGASKDDFTKISDEINGAVQTGNRYRSLRNNASTQPKNVAINDFGYAVSETYIKPTTEILRQDAIDTYKLNNAVQENGSFFQPNTQYAELFNRMVNTIAFTNRGLYDKNKVFRSGTISCGQSLLNPRSVIDGSPDKLPETNRPLLQDFIEPYEQKISFYYVFYVVSNGQTINKADEQVALLENSMSFVNRLAYSSTVSVCKTPDPNMQPRAENYGTISVPRAETSIVPIVTAVTSGIAAGTLIMDFTGKSPIANQRLVGSAYIRETIHNLFLKTDSPEFVPFTPTFVNIGDRCVKPIVNTEAAGELILPPPTTKARPLENLGNSCYFGSGLQLIYKMTNVRNAIVQGELQPFSGLTESEIATLSPEEIASKTNSTDSIRRVMQYMEGRASTQFTREDYASGRDLMICDNRDASQRDAGEFIISVLQKLPESVSKSYSLEIWNFYHAADGSSMNVDDSGAILPPPTEQVYPWVISTSNLNADRNVLSDALAKSFQYEIIGGSDARRDPRSSDYVFTVKCQILRSLPQHFLIQLLIFDPVTRQKLNIKTDLDLRLNLKTDNGKTASYTLSAVVLHVGEAHYTCAVLTNRIDRKLIYTLYNDTIATDIAQSDTDQFLSADALRGGTPYFLLYERNQNFV
jgi:hypothetical protein